MSGFGLGPAEIEEVGSSVITNLRTLRTCISEDLGVEGPRALKFLGFNSVHVWVLQIQLVLGFSEEHRNLNISIRLRARLCNNKKTFVVLNRTQVMTP